MTYSLKTHLKWSLSMTQGYRIRLITVLILEIIGIALTLLFVYWSKLAIDQAMNAALGNINLTLFYVITAVVGGIFIQLVTNRMSEALRIEMTINLQNHLIEGQMMSTWKFVKDWHTGDLLYRIQSDVTEVVQMLSQSAKSFLVTGLRLIASFCFLWTMDPMLALMIVAISPLFLFSKLYFRKMRRLSREIKEGEGNFGKVLQENLKFRMLVRALGLMSIRSAKIENTQHQIKNLKIEQLNFSMFTQALVKLTINGGYLLTFIWGVFRLQAGYISFGTMTAFLQLVGRIQTPVLQSVGFVPLFIKFRTSLDRILELFDSEKEVTQPARILKNPSHIAIERLSFKYADNTIINNLNVVIERGKPTAIIGSSGKGKTTLIRLLLSLIEPNEGNIWIEHQGKRLVLSNAHRNNIAYVPQGNTLFSGTIRENLEVNNLEITDDRIYYALSLACAEFVYDLPNGLDTVVGESGYGLSEGQAQRIAIARAMILDTSIWLFDEITSSLDQETSLRVMESLMCVGEDKILLFVTHDLQLANQCSQTIFMN